MSRWYCLALTALVLASPVRAGNVFVTGHDPDFHAADGMEAVNLLQVGLDFVTCDTTNTTTEKFLVVSARPADLGGIPAGHRDPIDAGFSALGLVEGLHFDVANAAAVLTVDFTSYTAIAVVSAFGGLLTRAELDALISRQGDIIDFLEAGGGVFASSECDATTGIACGAQLLAPAPAPMYGFLPFPLIPVASQAPFTVTAEGAALGLVDADVNDATHNSFADAAGLDVLDTDVSGVPTSLSGRWTAQPVQPTFDFAVVSDPSDCSVGLLVSWEEAVWEEPTQPGIYNVYRSEGAGASCADALTRPPVAGGLSVLSWLDRGTTPDIPTFYVVEAEDVTPAHGCDPPGPAGGAVTRVCIEPPITDQAMFPDPAGVFATLRATHLGDELTLTWTEARPLEFRETYRLFKSWDTPLGPFELVNGIRATSRSHGEQDTSSALQVFDLRVANACERISDDEYPAGW